MHTILLVDDDPGIRQLLARWLQPQGFRIIEAESAEAALEEVSAHGSIAAAVCDLSMPGKGGEWLVHRLRERAGNVAIVLATANNEVSPSVSLRDGVVAYVVKPFSQRAVVEAVREAIRWHSTQPPPRTDTPGAVASVMGETDGREDS